MDEFVDRQRRLVELEHTAEVLENEVLRSGSSAKELETMGLCIRSLHTSKVKTGLSGRILVTLTKETGDLPHTKLGNGDIVGIFTKDISNPECSGVVYSMHKAKIVIACDEFTLEEAICTVVLLANETTHKRQIQVLDAIRALPPSSHAYHLSRILLLEAEPRFSHIEPPILRLFNQSMNSKQVEAINFALTDCKDICIIHGPPGTGKTTTLVEVIKQLVDRGDRVLATAPSNIAVDNVLEQLAEHVPVVRLGHPARILAHLEKFSLDHQLKHSDQRELVLGINKDIAEVNDLINRSRGLERNEHRRHLKELRHEIKQREEKAVLEVMSRARVVLATNIAAGDKTLQKYIEHFGPFDTVAIDEAAQALEVACWIPLLKGKRLILAGDHKQLPPTIKSKEAQEGLSETLMGRICNAFPNTVQMLEMQYRMNEQIMRWPSQQFYEGRLQAHESVRAWSLPGVESPLMFIDTAGCEMRDSGEAGESKFNIGEASVVQVFIEEIRGLGVNDIGVITPYSAQVELLQTLSLGVEISTVDGFQGREKDAIVISFVRSNPEREVGFLADERRLNVAITRARKLLCIIADSDTLGSSKATDSLRSLMQHMHEFAVVRGVQAYYQDESRIVMNQGSFQPTKKPREPKIPKPKSQSKPSESTILSTFKPDSMIDIKERIEKFVQDEEAEGLALEPMPGNVREQVHRLCESLNLCHLSRGSGNSRFVHISKPVQPSPGNEVIDIESNPIIPEVPTESIIIPPRSDPVRIHKQKPKLQDTVSTVKLTDEEEMRLLDEMAAQNNKCNFSGCGKFVHVIAANCKFCRRTFCLEHGHAEFHGCGNQAREMARANLTKIDGKRLKEQDRKNLLEKLHKKQAEERPAPKQKKKKK